MDDLKNSYYYLGRILEDLKFVDSHMRGKSYTDFAANDLLVCSVCFKFVQVSENARNLPESA